MLQMRKTTPTPKVARRMLSIFVHLVGQLHVADLERYADAPTPFMWYASELMKEPRTRTRTLSINTHPVSPITTILYSKSNPHPNP